MEKKLLPGVCFSRLATRAKIDVICVIGAQGDAVSSCKRGKL